MAAWAGLRLDLIDRILGHIPCLAHRLAFGAVSFNWRAAGAQHPPPPQLPWLLLPSAAEEAPGFFCIRCGDTHPTFLPDEVRTARCCGSGSHLGGWLVLALHQLGGGYALHNLHTDARLTVPSLLQTAADDDMDEIGMIVLGAVLSAAPIADGACLAVVLAQCPTPIAFWVPGMAHLSPPTPIEPHERASWRDMLPGSRIADVIYYAGHGLQGFHVLTDAEEVLVYC